MHPHDAHLLRIKLESADIPVVVSDDSTVSVAPHLANAIGGVRVQVPDEYVGKAQAVLLEKPDTINLRDDLVCPKCGSTDIAQALHEKRSYVASFLVLLLMMIPLPLVKRRYQCNQCKHLWK